MELTLTLPSLDLKTVFEHLPPFQQADFKRFVSDDLGKRSRQTLPNWLNGVSEPSTGEKKLITDYFRKNIKEDITQQNLFPNKQ